MNAYSKSGGWMDILDLVDNLYFIAGIALAGGFSHCLGMCGGIVVAYSSTKNRPDQSPFESLRGHVLYNIGRTLTYGFMGAAVAALGMAFRLDRTLHGIFFVFVAILMILVGVSFLRGGKIPLLWDPSTSAGFQNTFRRFVQSPSPLSYLGIGLMNGLLPCGFVYFFIAMAAASGSVTQGALIMVVFGLCTLPPMLLLALAMDFFKRNQRLRNILNLFAGFSMLAFAGIFLYKSARLLGLLPS